MSLWEERAARNESLFRDVNEQMRALSDQFIGGNGSLAIVCECSDDRCIERLEVPLQAYEAIRGNSRRFLVAPGHEGAFERVVGEGAGYLIVEKEGDAGRVAEQNDPRS